MISKAKQDGAPVKSISQCTKNHALTQLLSLNLSRFQVKPVTSDSHSSEDFSLDVTTSPCRERVAPDFCRASSYIEVNRYFS